jgi:hypothetical protein
MAELGRAEHEELVNTTPFAESSRAQFYRTEAKRLREKAENMDSPEIRQAYEGMAIHYELLLEGLESPAKRSPPRKGALEWGWGN